ncbi:hypothetical protein [Aquihabitans sp. McL0605]|uniref:hypothetical protein n=1 Tax=Aquihabitans sp. McL0605 TaxID=3415671 RepID=UPI003CF470D8
MLHLSTAIDHPYGRGETHGIEDASLGLAPLAIAQLAHRRGDHYAAGYLDGYRSIFPSWDGVSGKRPPR